MSDITVIQGGKVIFPDRVKENDIIIKDGIIECTDHSGEIPEGAEIIDAHNIYVAPGFVEIHIHGGGGCDFMDCTDKAFEKISEIHRKHGITSMLPTAVSCGVDELTNLFDVYRRVINKETKTRFLGIHLEGPRTRCVVHKTRSISESHLSTKPINSLNVAEISLKCALPLPSLTE